MAETLENRAGTGARITVLAALAASWIAAGSTGLLSYSLQHVLTCCMLAISLVSAAK